MSSKAGDLLERLNPLRMEPIIQLFLLAFLGSIGVTMLFLACALPEYNNWLPLFVVLFYLLSPLPTLVARQRGGDSSSSGSRLWMDWAIFFTMSFVVTSFGLPLLLARWPVGKPSLQWGAALLTFSANLIIYLTLVIFFMVAFADDDF